LAGLTVGGGNGNDGGRKRAEDHGGSIAGVDERRRRAKGKKEESTARRPAPFEVVIPRSEKEGTKPPYVCPGCSNHMYSNNMITRFHVQ
jgi:hypothetical protein